jgi:hypothetical protein
MPVIGGSSNIGLVDSLSVIHQKEGLPNPTWHPQPTFCPFWAETILTTGLEKKSASIKRISVVYAGKVRYLTTIKNYAENRRLSALPQLEPARWKATRLRFSEKLESHPPKSESF